MSNIHCIVKGVMPSRHYIEIQYLLSSTYVQLQKKCLGQFITIVLGQVITPVATVRQLILMAQPANCVLMMAERTTFI